MQIVRVPRPPSRDDAHHPLTLGIQACETAVHRELHGHDDFADTPRARTVRLFGTDYGILLLWAALPDGVDPERCAADEVRGYAEAGIPLVEDTEKSDVYIGVRPDARRSGIGQALYDAVTAELRSRGRTTLMAYTYTSGPSAIGPHAVRAASGAGALDRTEPAPAWLLREGFVLEQCERPSVLSLGDPDALRARVRALAVQARASAQPDYKVLGWVDRTPQKHRDQMARLVSRMSTDVPMAGLGLDEQRWDAARLATMEERQIAMGYRTVTSVAWHRPSGELVAYTNLRWPDDRPAGICQEETLVRSDHRGHRLGLWIKAANLIRLLDANPAARRVHTWNAEENAHMLAINDTLGFQPHGLEGVWQRVIP